MTRQDLHGELVLAACVGKQRFLTRSAAVLVIKLMKRRGKGGASVFRCRFCHAWHIGHRSTL